MFTPVSEYSITLAKRYRAEQIEAAAQHRRAREARTSQRGTGSARAMFAAVAAAVHVKRPAV